MSDKNFIKNITSKDIKLSQNTIKTLIKTANIEEFGELVQKADFIFPFLKERISRDFVKLVEEEDLKVVFEFSKIYCPDFEDMIVESWAKFANEDLTDVILDLLENGTLEQKAYCAKYFSSVCDTLALDLLKKYSKSDFEPLKNNAIIALSAFGDVEILNEMKEIVLKSADDFEKFAAFNFISIYGGDEQIKYVFENAFSSPFLINIISNVLDNIEINHLKEILDEKTLIKIFQIIIEKYPEELSIDTSYYWNFIDYIKLIYKIDNQYSNNVLILTREKFREFSENDIYTFDFDKNIKTEIKNISKYLDSLDLECENFENYEDDFELSAILDVIKELKLVDRADFLVSIFNNVNEEKKAQIALILKELNKIDLISAESIEKIQNENIKALIKSIF